MAGIEIAQIPASIDYATLKQNEDMHSALVQSQAGAENEKKTDESHNKISTADKTEMRADDNGGGSGGYAGDGGRNRNGKKNGDGTTDKVVVKGSSSSFDIKI